MEQCAIHSSHVAIEHCEVCNKPLCGLCLWYTVDGKRLCEEHASAHLEDGEQVLPPETYAEAIGNSLVIKQPDRESESTGDDIPYKGNSEDLNALLAAVLGLTTLFSCVGGAYCLPVVAAALGLAAYANASKAVDPSRTRRLSIIGISVGGLLFFCLIAYFGAIFIFVLIALTSNLGGP